MLTSVGPQPTILSWFHRSTQVRRACAAEGPEDEVECALPCGPRAAVPGVVDAEATASAAPTVSATTVYLVIPSPSCIPTISQDVRLK
jgi:hypothetical protein